MLGTQATPVSYRELCFKPSPPADLNAVVAIPWTSIQVLSAFNSRSLVRSAAESSILVWFEPPCSDSLGHV